MPNKYVDFVSDEVFLEEVKKVVESYFNREEEYPELTELLKRNKYGIDEFKAIFDISVNNLTFKQWTKNEKIRQAGKKVENKIGEFHQQLLGRVDGWEDLGIGDKTKVDLRKEDNSIFIELKNKKNTINGDSGKAVRNKLEDLAKKYPDAICYWAYIVHGTYKAEDVIWKKKNYENNERIRRISCDKVYELVTGDPNALEKTFDALPKAIGDILETELEFSDEDEKLIKEFKEYIFD